MSTIRSAVLASGNPGKLRELRELLRGHIRLIDMRELALVAEEETGSSLEENARLKAFAAARQSGLPALSDDSGLEVDALGGAPGIYSSRYAGDDGNARANIRKLLKDLDGVPAGNRTARFRCVLVLAIPDNEQAPLIVEGVWEGRIAERAEGRRGFGYDPVFLDGRTGKCAALMSATEKGRRSHRGLAVRELVRALGRRGAGAG
ncbi:MAG: RdgB/HAM1 family non-canonical purine NTP pyrophosphatase [Gammaproteobacteria bacterium]|nr:RdgB/HAM1 family non-canonical purine NTP pyrophosphatase [Gammaproteobacteria bacterium]MYL00857.1 RdgB/HAM1 family non-canonical purine NTP pyrophosphatase [Gammaproteobacteria bacterium]